MLALSLLFLFSCNKSDEGTGQEEGGETSSSAGIEVGEATQASPPQFVAVCDRTSAVKEAILDELSGWFSSVECSEVTKEKLTEVTSLDLSGKELTQFKPGDFSGLTAVTEVSLSNNKFTSFPKEINQFSATLTELSASNNQLSGTGGWPVGFPHLKIINLSNNQLSSPPADWLKNMPAVEELNLRFNHLSPADVESLEQSAKAQDLDLGGGLNSQAQE